MLIVSAPCSRCRGVTVAAPPIRRSGGLIANIPTVIVYDRRRCTVHPIIKQHSSNIRVWVPFLCSHEPTLTIMPIFDPSHQAFESAKNAFQESLKDEGLLKDIQEAITVEDVWKLASDIQATQDAEKRLRHMAKMRSFLDKLEAYTVVVDTFVQVKPDLLALIWGPIRLLLVWTSNFAMFADALASAMKKIGDALPHFVEVVKIFSNNDRLKDLLALFYRDILDFYVITLEFFNLPRKL